MANEIKATYRHEFRIFPGYDKRDPNPSKNYGIHGVEMKWFVIGDKGAVQFVLSTSWYPSNVRRERGYDHGTGLVERCLVTPMPTDLGYHSPVPMHEGQTSISETCEFIGGGPCYYDGSTLNAEDPFDVLTDEGEEALWKFLEQYYEATFNGAEYPPQLGRRWKLDHANA
jgi:hypothetical protein